MGDLESKRQTDAQLGDQVDSEVCSASATMTVLRDHQLPLLSPLLQAAKPSGLAVSVPAGDEW